MITLNFSGSHLAITLNSGRVLISDGAQIKEWVPVDDCCYQASSLPDLVLAAWIAASWEFNFPNGFAPAMPHSLNAFNAGVTRESFDKALRFVECLRTTRPTPLAA